MVDVAFPILIYAISLERRIDFYLICIRNRIGSFLFHLQHPLLVQPINYRTIYLLSLMPLDLHCVCHYPLVQERLRLNKHVLGLLKTHQPSLLTNLSEIKYDLNPNCIVLAKRCKVTLNSFAGCQFFKRPAVRNSNCDHKSLSRIPVDEDLSQKRAFQVYIFYFLSSNILSLLQLENVLLPIDNTDSLSVGRHHTHISCYQPSILSHCLFGFFSIMVVTQKHSRTSSPYLTPRSRPTLLVFISAEILHFWNIHQFDFEVCLTLQRITTGPPTCLTTGSKAVLKSMAPVDSVCPQPSTRGAQSTTFKKCCTSGSRGALPEIMSLHFPPRASLVLAKNIRSQILWVQVPVFLRFSSLELRAYSKAVLVKPWSSLNFCFNTSQNRENSRGTLRKTVGFTIARSSFSFWTSPEKQTTLPPLCQMLQSNSLSRM